MEHAQRSKSARFIKFAAILALSCACSHEKMESANTFAEINNVVDGTGNSKYVLSKHHDKLEINDLIDSVKFTYIKKESNEYFYYFSRSKAACSDSVRSKYYILQSDGSSVVRYSFNEVRAKRALYLLDVVKGDTIERYKLYKPIYMDSCAPPKNLLGLTNKTNSWKYIYIYDYTNNYISISQMLPLHDGGFTPVLKHEELDNKKTLINILKIID